MHMNLLILDSYRDLLSVYAIDILINVCVTNAEKHQVSQNNDEVTQSVRK